jgi:predicted lipoprotein with Yx(FWY)xxD motif
VQTTSRWVAAAALAAAAILVIALSQDDPEAATITTAEHDTFGAYLADGEGMALYLFLPDEQGPSTCYDACAAAWPPLLTDGEPAAGESVEPKLLGTSERDDGSVQVSYAGWPLYYFARDAEPGDTAGQGINDVWYLVAPDGSAIGADGDDAAAADAGDGDAITSTLDGAFTAEQVERGADAYRQHCASCHGSDLLTVDEYAPDLRGPAFTARFVDRTLAERFERISSTMPQNAPGSLDDQAYVDILAFLLEFNGYPTGDTELVADMDVLEGIVIERRP